MQSDPSVAAPDARATTGTMALIAAWVAVGLGVLAVPGALMFIPALDGGLILLWGDLSPVPAVLSWICALIAVIMGLALAIRRRTTRRSRIALGLAAPGTVLGTIALVVVVLYVGNLLGIGAENRAKTAAKPVLQHYTSNGATVLCSGGDSGHGPDNTQPWYYAYIDAPKSLATKKFTAEALADAHAGAGKFDTVDDARQGTYAMRAHASGKYAWIVVIPHGSEHRQGQGATCADDRVGPGRALIEVDVQRPHRNVWKRGRRSFRPTPPRPSSPTDRTRCRSDGEPRASRDGVGARGRRGEAGS